MRHHGGVATHPDPVPLPDYLALSDADLLRDCTVETFRASGPGGQKRNKTDSAVRITHRPSGVQAQAFEQRSQHQNRVQALFRLRRGIALAVRRPVDLDAYAPPPDLVAILPTTPHNRLGPAHPGFWRGAQALLDLFVAVGGAIGETAHHAGISTGQMVRLIQADDHLLAAVNQWRSGHGLRPLR